MLEFPRRPYCSVVLQSDVMPKAQDPVIKNG